MTLDDVYGAEHDRFPLEQERKPAIRALEWGDAADNANNDGSVDGRWCPAASRVGEAVAVLLQAPRRAA